MCGRAIGKTIFHDFLADFFSEEILPDAKKWRLYSGGPMASGQNLVRRTLFEGIDGRVLLVGGAGTLTRGHEGCRGSFSGDVCLPTSRDPLLY